MRHKPPRQQVDIAREGVPGSGPTAGERHAPRHAGQVRDGPPAYVTANSACTWVTLHTWATQGVLAASVTTTTAAVILFA